MPRVRCTARDLGKGSRTTVGRSAGGGLSVRRPRLFSLIFQTEPLRTRMYFWNGLGCNRNEGDRQKNRGGVQTPLTESGPRGDRRSGSGETCPAPHRRSAAQPARQPRHRSPSRPVSRRASFVHFRFQKQRIHFPVTGRICGGLRQIHHQEGLLPLVPLPTRYTSPAVCLAQDS